MKQFSLDTATNVKVINVNVRSERRGKDHVPAVDVKVRMTGANTILDDLRGPDMRAWLYMRPEAGGEPPQEPELDGMPVITDTPLLRIAGLEPIRLTDELSGYAATFDIGIGRKESLVELGGCKLKKFEITALQGGSIHLDFTISAAGVKEREIGKLGVLMECEVPLLLAPPTEQQTVEQAEERADSAIGAAMKKAGIKKNRAK